MAIYKEDIVNIDLEGGKIFRSFLNHTIGEKDSAADRFGIRVFRNGEAVNLSGASCQAVFIGPVGNPIALTNNGTVSGNVAYVTLPQACYNYEGQFSLAIKLVDAGAGITGTMRIVDGVVDRTGASGAVAPTENIPTYQEILAVYEDMLEALEAAKSIQLCTCTARIDWDMVNKTVSLTDGYLVIPGAFYHITTEISASYQSFANETYLLFNTTARTISLVDFMSEIDGVVVAVFNGERMRVGGLYDEVYLNGTKITPENIFDGFATFVGRTVNEFYNYNLTPNFTEVTAGYVWMINKNITPGSKIKDLTIYTADNNTKTFYVSLWNANTGERYKNTQYTVTPVNKILTLPLMEDISVATKFGLYSSAGLETTTQVSGESLLTVPYTDTTLENAITVPNWVINIKVTLYGDSWAEEIAKKEIHVGPDLQYTEIQPALDALTGNYATIIVHPKNTPYARFSLMRKLSESYPWNGLSTVKHISIIGVDKAKCVIESDTGNYDTPPAEIATNGIIQNLTFISTHSASDGTETAGSYAVHVDNRPADTNGMKLEFDNCDFVSYQCAAVGLGLYKNQDIRFRNCRLISITDPTWKPNQSYNSAYMCELGAFFMHTTMGYAGGNMFIRFNDCILTHDGGTHSMWCKDEDTVKTALMEATGNTFWCANSAGTDVLNQLNLMPYNHGNNAANLNA